MRFNTPLNPRKGVSQTETTVTPQAESALPCIKSVMNISGTK